MESELFDCTWCGSARSVEHGLCQVCLMEYPKKTQILRLPDARRAAVMRARPLEPKVGVSSGTRRVASLPA
ncbi:MAG: hypothetical protein HY775_09800 [Acidobacteria bacterium]|nr:hypothetical protein [Acidobacteriota bacterium]